jgi:hypothetical protein
MTLPQRSRWKGAGFAGMETVNINFMADKLVAATSIHDFLE